MVALRLLSEISCQISDSRRQVSSSLASLQQEILANSLVPVRQSLRQSLRQPLGLVLCTVAGTWGEARRGTSPTVIGCPVLATPKVGLGLRWEKKPISLLPYRSDVLKPFYTS